MLSGCHCWSIIDVFSLLSRAKLFGDFLDFAISCSYILLSTGIETPQRITLNAFIILQARLMHAHSHPSKAYPHQTPQPVSQILAKYLS